MWLSLNHSMGYGTSNYSMTVLTYSPYRMAGYVRLLTMSLPAQHQTTATNYAQ